MFLCEKRKVFLLQFVNIKLSFRCEALQRQVKVIFEKEENGFFLPAKNFLLLTKIAKISDRKRKEVIFLFYIKKKKYARTFTCELIDVSIKDKISNASDLFIVLISIQLRHFVEENYLFTLVSVLEKSLLFRKVL